MQIICEYTVFWFTHQKKIVMRNSLIVFMLRSVHIIHINQSTINKCMNINIYDVTHILESSSGYFFKRVRNTIFHKKIM